MTFAHDFDAIARRVNRAIDLHPVRVEPPAPVSAAKALRELHRERVGERIIAGLSQHIHAAHASRFYPWGLAPEHGTGPCPRHAKELQYVAAETERELSRLIPDPVERVQALRKSFERERREIVDSERRVYALAGVAAPDEALLARGIASVGAKTSAAFCGRPVLDDVRDHK